MFLLWNVCKPLRAIYLNLASVFHRHRRGFTVFAFPTWQMTRIRTRSGAGADLPDGPADAGIIQTSPPPPPPTSLAPPHQPPRFLLHTHDRARVQTFSLRTLQRARTLVHTKPHVQT